MNYFPQNFNHKRFVVSTMEFLIKARCKQASGWLLPVFVWNMGTP